LDDQALAGDFEKFMSEVEPRLVRALVARFGIEVGRESAVDALVYGWIHWERVRAFENPAGYLYRVGVSSARPRRLEGPIETWGSDWHEPWIEPGLETGLASLSATQRTTVVLRHSFGWTYQEIAELLDVSVSTVRNHLDRGMEKLRTALKVGAADD
jgi:RNA polymerase sigma-70 factor (ECF subfamily)